MSERPFPSTNPFAKACVTHAAVVIHAVLLLIATAPFSHAQKMEVGPSTLPDPVKIPSTGLTYPPAPSSNQTAVPLSAQSPNASIAPAASPEAQVMLFGDGTSPLSAETSLDGLGSVSTSKTKTIIEDAGAVIEDVASSATQTKPAPATTAEPKTYRLASATVGDTPVSEAIPHSEVAALEARLAQLDGELASMRSRARRFAQPQKIRMPSKLFVGFESVFLQPAQQNNTGLIVQTNQGYSHVPFPWEMEHTPRITLGWDSGSDAFGWRVRFWQFRHNESFSVGLDNLLPSGFEGTVGYLSEDGDIDAGLAFIEEGDFKSHVRTDVIDWELQRHLSTEVNLFAGIRYGKVRQSYTALTDRGAAYADSQFRGIGPTLAIEFERRLPLNRLALFANARGALMMGQKEFSVIDDVNNDLHTIGAIDLRSLEEGGDTVATNAEVHIGIRYDLCRFFALTFGVELQHFGNVGGANPTAAFAGDDSGLSGDSPMDDDLALFGITFGSQLMY